MSLKCKYQFQVFVFPSVIQETIIPYFLETTGKYMHQVSSVEFCVIQGDLAFGVSRLFAPGREGNFLRCNRQYPVVRNGDSVSITTEILDGIAKAVEGFLDIRAPVFFIKTVFPLFPVIRITQLFTGRRKIEGAAFIKGRKMSHILSLELIPQDFCPDKKFTGRFCYCRRWHFIFVSRKRNGSGDS